MDSWEEYLTELNMACESIGQNYFSESYKIYIHFFILLNIYLRDLEFGQVFAHSWLQSSVVTN